MPGPSALRHLRIQARAHRAVAITVPLLAKERLAARHAMAQPLASRVSEGTGTLRVDPVPLAELVQVDLRHTPYRLADLISNGTQPILKAVVFAHAPDVGRYRPAATKASKLERACAPHAKTTGLLAEPADEHRL